MAASGISSYSPFTREFTTTAISLVASTDNAQAHGFGVVPKLIQVFFKCTTAENGYAIGDEYHPVNDGNPANATTGLYKNATNVGLVIFNNIWMSKRSATIGDGNFMTYANWKAYIRAWA
jgi:hypothetical protein